MILALFIAMLLMLSACSSDIPTRLSFSQPQYAGGGQQSLSMSSMSIQQNQAQEATHYSWAHLDGLRLYLLSAGIDGNDVHTELFKSDHRFLLDLHGESTRLSLPEVNDVEPGVYNRFQFEVQSQYDLKAWARVTGKTCYTTRAQIVCVDGEVEPAQFVDYDYYHYNFLHVTTSRSTDDRGNRSHFSGVIPGGFRVNDNLDSLDLQMVIDTYRIVTFWDGQQGGQGISPFNWSNNYNLPTSAFFPGGTPNFGVSYVPIFLSINDPGTPKAEVYIVGSDRNNVDAFVDGSYNLSSLQYLTTLFRSTGEYLEARVIGFDQGPLWQLIGDFHQEADGYFSFSNGEYKPHENRNWQDRIITGFQRTSTGVLQDALMNNGPDCGNGALDPYHPEWGPRTRACDCTNEPIFFKRMR